jgi:hypothetical protein
MITFEPIPRRQHGKFKLEREPRRLRTTAETSLRHSRPLSRLGIAQRWIEQ